MELGRIQKLWIKQLKKHPERQTTFFLGSGDPRDYEACCLGELHLCAHRISKKRLPFFRNPYLKKLENTKRIEDREENIGNSEALNYSYKKYGLRDPEGEFKNLIKFKGNLYQSLSDMNDYGVSWPDIAEVVEKDPENVFDKSV